MGRNQEQNVVVFISLKIYLLKNVCQIKDVIGGSSEITLTGRQHYVLHVILD